MATQANRMLVLATKFDANPNAPTQKFVIERFSGREELARMFEYQLDLVSEAPDIAPDDLLGTNATVRVELPGGKGHRFFNGYITRFSVHGQVSTPAFTKGVGFKYTATLSPWLWFLTRTATCHVSVNKTFRAVIEAVLGRWAPLPKFKFDTSDPTEQREHLVQYRETDFNYVSRLAEQCGFYYHFEQADGEHTMVFVDDASKIQKNPDLKSNLKYFVDKRDEDTVSLFELSTEVQSGAYAVDDFNPMTPQTQLVKVATDARRHANAGFEIYDYPGEFKDLQWADKYARFRMQELQCRFGTFRGVTTNRTVRVGTKMALEHHPISGFNGEYMVVSHSFSAVNNLSASGAGQGAEFNAEFTCLPAGTQFRAARVTPKPVIAGPQTALVVGPSSKEINTDAHARVQVQFHWDRLGDGTGTNQCWVRVSQLLAGKGWGWVNVPRVGQEVVVEFLEGDPDRPLVTGRVYNDSQKPPYDLTKNPERTGLVSRTAQGGNSNFNELRFDDKGGEEQVYLQAERNLDIRVKKDFATSVLGKTHLTIDGDTSQKFGADLHTEVTGDHNNKVGGALSFKVTQAAHLKASKFLVDTESEVHLKAGAKVILEASTQISLKVGSNFVDINSAGVFIKGSLVNINSGGSAGSGSGASPVAPKEPTAAITSQGGDKSPAVPARPAPVAYQAQASTFKAAAASGAPFCAQCQGC